MCLTVFTNPPTFFLVEAKICNSEFIMLTDYDVDLTFYILNLTTNVWSHHSLPFVGISHVHMVDCGDCAIVVVWKNNISLAMIVNYESGDIEIRMDAEPLSIENIVVMSTSNEDSNYITAFAEDPQLHIPIRTRILWIKKFNPSTLSWTDCPVPDKPTDGFFQGFAIGDFLFYFINKYRDIACLHNGVWRDDLRVPVTGLPPWNCWSTSTHGLIMWDVWPSRMDVYYYDLLG
jgi:hypothetical protein